MKGNITKAIGAHGLWKTNLKRSLDVGCIEHDPVTVQKDNLCDFGKWLYSEEMKPLAKDSNYQKILALHADFHIIVGQVLRYIEEGNTSKADEMMSPQGAFTLISQKLVGALMDWSKTL